ncbi:hypothetical protein [Microbulbifer sp. VVAC002]|uniref:hypothetical protein n=2 Tax=unclassified Microbulbifer TaxID=2619833 RepID=UPI004039BF6E
MRALFLIALCWAMVDSAAAAEKDQATTIAVYGSLSKAPESAELYREFHWARRANGGLALIFRCGKGQFRYAVLKADAGSYSFEVDTSYEGSKCPLGKYSIELLEDRLKLKISTENGIVIEEALPKWPGNS